MMACRAQVEEASDGGYDLATDAPPAPPDLSPPPPDLASSDLACSGPVGPELCGNGCDDDHNGYFDEDDPACTPQVLVTSDVPIPLSRLILSDPPRLVAFDKQIAPDGTMATYRRSFNPMVYLIDDISPGGLLRSITPGIGFTDMTPKYRTRDVCVFNDQLIVVESDLISKLHRYRSDGMSEILPPIDVGPTFVSGCTSAGDQLIVAVDSYSIAGPGEFIIYDRNLVKVGNPVQMPNAILDLGFDRCIDLAWTSKGLYGLFVQGTKLDQQLNASQVFPFALDGGAGDPLDLGFSVHGIGEFAP